MTVGALLQCTSFGLPQFIVGRIVSLSFVLHYVMRLSCSGHGIWEWIHHSYRRSEERRVGKE